MLHRVGSLLQHLDYSQLRQGKILPTKPVFSLIKRGGSFPTVAKKVGYWQFGLFLDHFIRKVIALHLDLPYASKLTPAYDIYQQCMRLCGEEKLVSRAEFHRDKSYYRQIANFIQESFAELNCDRSAIQFEPEWAYDQICGHPDVIFGDTIYDIKTTGQFNKMRTSAICQVLAYYCLAQLNSIPIRYVGLILPAQRTVLRVDLRGWHWPPFWQVLAGCIQTKLTLQPSQEDLILYQSMVAPYVGYHTERQSTVRGTLENLDPSKPWQIFLAGRTKAEFKISQRDKELTAALGRRWYIHAPYTLNLSRRTPDDWTAQSLINILQAGAEMGCRGVVVHCGVKAKNVEFDTAYQEMYETVVKAAESATPDCPLLLETSAGETGELLSDPDDFIAFLLSIPDDIRRNIKVCLDSCHVFAAGYRPRQFVEKLIDSKVPIGLIHYNDCKGPLGCRKDRHAGIGRGYIGLPELFGLGMFALQHKIDLVHE